MNSKAESSKRSGSSNGHHALDVSKLEFVKSTHRSILQKRAQIMKQQNESLLKKSLANSKADFGIECKVAQPIKVPVWAKKIKIKRKRNVKEENIEVPIIHLEKIEHRPDRPHFTPSQINLEVEDDPVLNYVPYFDDQDNDFLNSLFEAYDNKCHEATDTSLSIDIIIQLVKELKKANLKNASSPSSSSVSPSFEGKLRNSFKSNSVNNKQKDSKETFTYEEIFEYIAKLYEGKENVLKAKEIKELYERHVAPKIATMPNIDVPLEKFYAVDLSLDTYIKLFCPICRIYDCLLHQCYDVQKPRLDNMPLNENESPCGPDCFLNLDSVNINDYLPANPSSSTSNQRNVPKKYSKIYEKSIKKKIQLSNNDRTLLAVYIDTYKDNYCAITQLMNAELPITCYEVYQKAQEIKKTLGEKSVPQERFKNDNSKKPKHKHRKKTSVWKNFLTQKSDLRKSYVPCNHPGESCKTAKNCSCAENETCCEKYCMCSDDCPLRFPGCNCKSSCQTAKCACYLAYRECDGDRCKCTADVSSLDELRCKNCFIQRGIGKHLLLGVSQVAGWGVYLNGTADKNDLISEYCGELISHHDAEARGIVYDKTGVSFLFDLNKDSKTCDAKNIGNKIRFANHDSADPNCYPRIMSVNGFHRIGIYAKRRIREQEELFFDYGTVKFNPADRAMLRD